MSLLLLLMATAAADVVPTGVASNDWMIAGTGAVGYACSSPMLVNSGFSLQLEAVTYSTARECSVCFTECINDADCAGYSNTHVFIYGSEQQAMAFRFSICCFLPIRISNY